MREFLSKLKSFRAAIKERAKKIDYRLRIFLYSLPFFGFLASAENVKAAGGTGLIGVAGSGIANLAGSIIGSGAQAGVTLLVWVWIINQLSEIVSDIAGGVFLFLINFLIGVSQYNSFLGSSVVTIGWSVTRDLANMFLVVALLVIAFGTILSINNYQASNLLKQFLFAAILVNFSKTICGVLIDASQVVMMTFVSGYSETAAGNFVNMFQVEKWLQLAIGNASSQLGQTEGIQTVTTTGGLLTSVVSGGADVIASIASNLFSGVAANVFTAIIAFIGIIAVLSLDIILVVRIVTLWFLIVASPIAFVAKVLPVTKGFSGRWWSAFNQQLVAGPVVAFIVWISLASISVSDTAFSVINQAGQGDKLFAETTAATSAVAATKISQWENLALYFVPIVIFMLGAKWAVSISGGFAKSIAGFASKQVKGIGMGALARVRKTALSGKGDFSVLTAAKKGAAGEHSAVTSFIGKVGGVVGGAVDQKLFGGSIGRMDRRLATATRRMETKGGILGTVATGVAVVGGAAGFTAAQRARKAVNYKNLKVNASRFGFGEYGAKRKEAEDAEALAQYHAETARQKFEYYSEQAKNATDADKKREYEEQALGYKATYETKAAEARKKAKDNQKDLFKLEGQSDPLVLVQTLKNLSKSGEVSELQVDVAGDLIDEHYEKEEKKRIEKAKAAAGANWANISTTEQEKIKGEVAAEKAEVKGRIRQVAEDANRHSLGDDEMERRQRIETESKQYRANFVQSNNKFDPQAGAKEAVRQRDEEIASARANGGAGNNNNGNPNLVDITDRSNKKLAKNLADRLTDLLVQRPDATFQDQEQIIMAGVAGVSVKDQRGVLDALKREAEARITSNPNNTELRDAVASIENKIQGAKNKTVQYRDEIEDRWRARENKGNRDMQYNQVDIGMNRVGGKYEFSAENLIKFQALLEKEPEIIVKLNMEALSNPEVRRAIGGAIKTEDQLQEIAININNSENDMTDPGGMRRKQRIAHVLRGVRENVSASPELQSGAEVLDSLIRST